MKTFFFNNEICHARVLGYGTYQFEVSGETRITHDSEMYDYIDDEDDAVKHQEAVESLNRLFSK